MKKQAIAVVVDGKDFSPEYEGKVLGVSRRNDHTAFGFPGGKVDPGETLLGAALRELEEETGIKCTKLSILHTGIDNDEYEVTTFTFDKDENLKDAFKNFKNIDSREGLVEWVEWDVLTNEQNRWSEYNQAVREAWEDRQIINSVL